MPKDITIERNTKVPHVTVRDAGDIMQYDIRDKRVKISKELQQAYEDILNPDLPFMYRVKKFLTAQSKAGRIAKSIKDFTLMFTPYGKQINNVTDVITHIIEPKRTEKPMLSKIMSIKGFIKIRDEDGNLDWEQVAASVIQIVIAGAVVYGANALGLWKQLSSVLGIE